MPRYYWPMFNFKYRYRFQKVELDGLSSEYRYEVVTKNVDYSLPAASSPRI